MVIRYIYPNSVCGADPGREAGLDASHAINTDVDLGGGITRTYIMADKGGVNCFGVVKVN